MSLQQHPLSAAFPSMSDVDLDALAEDIKKHAQREPGLLYEGMVLDGWHRYRACQKAGVEFKAVEFAGADPIAFVLSQNLHRRHLTASQRAAAIVACTNWRPLGDQKSRSAPGADRTAEEMAKAAEVSPRTIEQAKEAHRAGLGDAVKEGKVSAKRAAEVAKLPPKQREKALAEKPHQDPKPKVVVADPKVEQLYEQVKAELVAEREAKQDLADTARELEDRLSAFENTEPDEQQKEIMKLQKRIVRLEAEVERLTRARNDCQAKNNELIREVKRLKRKAGE